MNYNGDFDPIMGDLMPSFLEPRLALYWCDGRVPWHELELWQSGGGPTWSFHLFTV